MEERLRRLLTAMVSGLIGYVLFGTGLLPVEKVPVIAAAVQNWVPYEVLPVLVSLIFAGLGLFWVELVAALTKKRRGR